VELIWMRAAGLVRRGWRATVLFAVVAGLAAGVAMAVVAAGRRTASVYDRFAAFADVPELLANFCPPGFDPAEGSLEVCFLYDAHDERDTIAALPEVEAAARGEFRGVTIVPTSSPDDRYLGTSVVMQDEGIVSPYGRYRIIEGADATGAHEIVVNRHLAEEGIGIGDEVELTFWAEEDFGNFDDDAVFHGPTLDVRVSGIAVSLTDLAAAQDAPGLADEASVIYGGPGLDEATPTAAGFGGLMVEAVDDDREAAEAAIQDAFPDRPFNLVPAVGNDEIQPTRDAIRYEAQATFALGLVVAVVVAAFLVQALARQSRREWSDGPTLRAVGVSRRMAVASSLLRSLAISLPAVVLAVVTAVLLSPIGPVGAGRVAEVDGGIEVDAVALAVGAVAIAFAITVGITAPLLRGRILRTAPPPVGRATEPRDIAAPPVLSIGLQFARRERRGSLAEVSTALVGVGAAVAVAVAAAALAASFTDLTRTPERFGAPWDLSLGSSGTTGAEEAVTVVSEDALRSSIANAAVLTGTDLQIGDDVAWVHAFVPLDDVEVIDPPIIDGRAPADIDEIALGGLTMRDQGLSIGDEVEVASSSTGTTYDLEIVGEAVINDTFEASPGRGGVVTPELIAEAAPEVETGDPLVLTFDEGVDVDAFVDEVRESFGGAVQGPVEQAAIRNVGRIRDLPMVMAAVVAVLALASLVHALVLSVGRNRRILGVLKAIGFTRVQVGGTIACHAMAFALVALVVSVPLGIAAGRGLWRLIAEGLGVPAVSVVPPLTVAGVCLGAFVLANLAAAYPAWRAAHLATADALRAE
jgi:hypothetical protein